MTELAAIPAPYRRLLAAWLRDRMPASRLAGRKERDTARVALDAAAYELERDPGPGPEYLVTATTGRGFDHMPPIRSVHAGRTVGAVRVYESSDASGPHLWLNAENTDASETPGWTTETAVHLSCENAVRLTEQILYLVRNHYQNDDAQEPTS